MLLNYRNLYDSGPSTSSPVEELLRLRERGRIRLGMER